MSADDMILYIENSEDSKEKLQKINKRISKVLGHKINI